LSQGSANSLSQIALYLPSTRQMITPCAHIFCRDCAYRALPKESRAVSRAVPGVRPGPPRGGTGPVLGGGPASELGVGAVATPGAVGGTAGERGRDNLKDSRDFRSENGSSQGQNMASTVLLVPNALNSILGCCLLFAFLGILVTTLPSSLLQGYFAHKKHPPP
jgi:hypothetical protein